MKDLESKKKSCRKYSFSCPRCGQIIKIIETENLQKYLRAWELLQSVPLSSRQIAEFEELCAEGYRYMALFCPNDKCKEKSGIVITSREEFKAFEEHIRIV